ncbi:MAG: lysophospholipid acyltransferase family protein [Pseudomonadota bacterium]
MSDRPTVDNETAEPKAPNDGLLMLYPLWQWLVLIPLAVLFTIFAAPVAIVMCLLGYKRAANRHIAANWARFIAQLTPLQITVEGLENIQPGQSYVVVSNHQSQYDIPLIYGYSGLDLRWVMKAEIGFIPFVAQGCRALGHVFIDRGDPDQARAAINLAVANLPDGTGILFFPEGTRSRSGELMKFRKGAFRVAVDRQLPILPMTVIGTRDRMASDSFRIVPGPVRLVIHPPLLPPEMTDDTAVERLRQRTRTIIASAMESNASESTVR